MGAERQTNIHTYIHTYTHTFRKTISGNQAHAWFKKWLLLQDLIKFGEAKFSQLQLEIRIGQMNACVMLHSLTITGYNLYTAFTILLKSCHTVSVSKHENIKYSLT